MSATTPIIRYELNDQVYRSIKERLLTREFGGGAKLGLQALADDLGVSRSPVSHALTRLVADGLVVSDRRGFHVRPLTAELMTEAHEARLALELHAAELTVEHVSLAELEAFRSRMTTTQTAVREREILNARGYMLANKEFHEFQVDLAGNSFLSDMYRRLCLHQLMERTILVLGISAAGGSSEEHEAIVNAFERHNLSAARDALRRNVETGKAIALEALIRAGGVL